MKLDCHFCVKKRLLDNKPPSVCGFIAIAKKTSNSSVASLYVHANSKKITDSYKIASDIKIFQRYLAMGCATLRLQLPPHDIFISKAEPKKLCQFLTLVKHYSQVQSKTSESQSLLTFDKILKHHISIITKMTISKRSEYPTSRNFPVTLVSLTITNCALIRIDPKIFLLPNLRHLDMCNNRIKFIPGFNQKLNIQSLNFSGNQISEIPVSFGWNFPLLEELHLSENLITTLPNTFFWLTNLKVLSLKRNKMRKISSLLKFLVKLKYLNLESVNLECMRCLPVFRMEGASNYSIVKDRDCKIILPSFDAEILEPYYSVDYVQNKFRSVRCIAVRSLIDECVVTILKSKIPYGTLPPVLRKRIDSPVQCCSFCHRILFDYRFYQCTTTVLNFLTHQYLEGSSISQHEHQGDFFQWGIFACPENEMQS